MQDTLPSNEGTLSVPTAPLNFESDETLTITISIDKPSIEPVPFSLQFIRGSEEDTQTAELFTVFMANGDATSPFVIPTNETSVDVSIASSKFLAAGPNLMWTVVLTSNFFGTDADSSVFGLTLVTPVPTLTTENVVATEGDKAIFAYYSLDLAGSDAALPFRVVNDFLPYTASAGNKDKLPTSVRQTWKQYHHLVMSPC
jgi:hypothetical protein